MEKLTLNFEQFALHSNWILGLRLAGTFERRNCNNSKLRIFEMQRKTVSAFESF
jgi:hypothetical protein